jgi:hypothetical protein
MSGMTINWIILKTARHPDVWLPRPYTFPHGHAGGSSRAGEPVPFDVWKMVGNAHPTKSLAFGRVESVFRGIRPSTDPSPSAQDDALQLYRMPYPLLQSC